MKLSMRPVRPCTFNQPSTPTPKPTHYSCAYTLTQPPKLNNNNNKLVHHKTQPLKHWERLLDPIDHSTTNKSNTFPYHFMPTKSVKLGKKWKEYQGIRNWDGLLDPLDDNLRSEILRYGQFVEAAYKSFDFDPSSPSYATCLFPKSSLLEKSGLAQTGYRLTKNLRATSGIQLPRWIEKAPSWAVTKSSWIGYVAVCQDKEEIARLGRRDVVIAFRGTATCLEWLENLRATLTQVGPNHHNNNNNNDGPMVESGFLSLYTSGTKCSTSLQTMVREEISRLLQSYGDEPLSLTITGHSLGAALATLAAYDIKTAFTRAPLVTVISLGGPRVGNRSFRRVLEKQGTKILRIVNSDDLITKVPGFVIDKSNENDNDDQDDMSCNRDVQLAGLIPSWIQKRVEDTQWVYAEVGRELRLSSRDSPYLNGFNFATCHELKTYLHLVDGFVSSTCPFRASARMLIDNYRRQKSQGLKTQTLKP